MTSVQGTLESVPSTVGILPFEEGPSSTRLKKGEPGRHWVAFWVSGLDILFFDSGGHPPKHYNFNLRGYRVRNNGVGWQSPGTYYCGYYCLFFLLHTSRGIYKLMSKLRSENLRRNDYLVYRVCHRIFHVPEVLI